MSKTVFVFGSNTLGRHGAGAALTAYKKYGARMGFSYGHMSSNWGDSFAIPTKDHQLRTLPYRRIHQYVQGFLAYAHDHPELTFMVTRVGCGLAGIPDQSMAACFDHAPTNCQFDEKWRKHLGDEYTYWGALNG